MQSIYCCESDVGKNSDRCLVRYWTGGNGVGKVKLPAKSTTKPSSLIHNKMDENVFKISSTVNFESDMPKFCHHSFLENDFVFMMKDIRKLLKRLNHVSISIVKGQCYRLHYEIAGWAYSTGSKKGIIYNSFECLDLYTYFFP